MLDTDTKRRIDSARDILVGKVPDPKSQVEQITIALIYKFMDDMDTESEELGGERSFFKGEFEKYAWRKIFAPEQIGKPATKPQPSADDLQAQLQAAQDEIRHLKEQRDILKKTLGILSEPPRNGSKGSMR